MSAPFWVVDLADRFWAEVGEAEPFPRQLCRSIARALPLSVVLLPRLWTANVLDWLRQHEIAYPMLESDRPLRACLFARYGGGFVFIDGSDSEDEQRFSVAHELAHFLRHYWQPRRNATCRLGEQVGEVFDGLRPPTREEDLRSLLSNIPIGFHMHLMSRDEDGGVSSAAIAVAEAEADRLAYELLAPAASVLASATRAALVGRLREVYGLPGMQARAYARQLMPMNADPFLARLGISE